MLRAGLLAAALSLAALGTAVALPAADLLQRGPRPAAASARVPAEALAPASAGLPRALHRAPGSSAAAFPPRAAVRAALAYARERAGAVSVALIDSRGRLHGLDARRRYVSASVVKAMLLVAYLCTLGDRPPTPAERALLGPMIGRSSNRSADEAYRRVGALGLLALAERARMRAFSILGSWTSALITAADQARFLLRFERFVPPRSRAYARHLLGAVRRHQRWGFTRAAERAGFGAAMKAGWRATAAGRLVHAVARFERDGRRIALAVLTDGNPSHRYGTATLRGIARRVFAPSLARAGPRDGRSPHAAGATAVTATRAGARAHRRAGLVDVLRDAPGIVLAIRYASARNLTGAPLPGYCKPWALLLEPAARDLARVQRRLRRRGLGLKVFDAYRPVRATRALVRWARRSGRGGLVGTYIARRSRHNVGAAVDLTLVRAGRQLRMGGGYDDLGPRAHTHAASGRALRNRLLLRRAMERFGFAPYEREWWHFEHRGAGAAALDLPLGCG